jgi:hypothetical protein
VFLLSTRRKRNANEENFPDQKKNWSEKETVSLEHETKEKREEKKFLNIKKISQRHETNEKQDEMIFFLSTQRKKRIWFFWARREKIWLNLSFRYKKRENDVINCREQCLRLVNWSVRQWICRCMMYEWWY